jgi:hypothetical protein
MADLYVPPGGRLFFASAQGVGIFGNMHVAGSLGTETGSTLQFFGQTWINDTTATFPDETANGTTPGRGGAVAFTQPHPLHGNLGLQTITGGYDVLELRGAAMPEVRVDNSSGVVLMNGDMSVRNTLALQKGHLFLNGYNLAVGHSTGRGRITGYTPERFVVTGVGQTGGALSMLSIGDGDTAVFPIGTDEGEYTPAAIANQGQTDHFRARVFDGVLENGLSGPDISDRGVRKTWMIASSGNDFNAKLMLQHNTPDEGSLYQQNRHLSYLSRLAGSQWDTGSVYGTPAQPGWMTTGPAVAIGAISERALEGTGGAQYYTSLVRTGGEVLPPECSAQFTYFLAWKENAFKVKLNWGVLARPGVVSYHVEKRIARSGVWKTVAVIPAVNVFDYTWEDNDVYYDDDLAYRIRLNCQTGEYLYSDVRVIMRGDIAIIYPNPNSGKFTLSVTDHTRAKAAVIYDAAGKKVRMRTITSRDTEFDISDVAAGVYFVSVISTTDTRLITLKVLKTN